jgi:MFS family permease
MRRPNATFVVLGTVQVTLIATMTVISVALPAIQRELDLSDTGLALVNNAYPVSFCGLLLFGGRLGDLLGRRSTFLLGTGIFAVASGAAGLAPGLVPLLLARLGQGCGAALAAPAALALLGAVYPDPRRARRAVAVWGGLPVAGATAGLLLSGVVVEWLSWRWAFAAAIAIAIAVFALTPRLVPKVPAADRQRPDLAGAALATAGMTTLCFGLVTAGERGWSSPTVLGAVLGGAFLLVAFVGVESRVRAPLVAPRFFRSRRRATGLVAVMLASSATTAVTFYLPLYFQQVRGFSAAATSAAFVPYALAMFGTGLVTGRLVPRLGDRWATVVGLSLAAVGLFLIAPLRVPLLFAGLVLFPIGVSLVFSAGTVAALDEVPADQAGLSGGVLNTAMEGGPALGFAVLVSVSASHTVGLRAAGVAASVAATSGYGLAIAVTAIAYVLFAAVAAGSLRTGRRRERRGGADRRGPAPLRAASKVGPCPFAKP